MAVVSLPVNPSRFHHRFRVDLDGTFYRFVVHYIQPMESWAFDLLADDETVIVAGIRFCVSPDLLAQYRHLGVPPGRLGVVDTQGQDQEPDRDNFGTRVLPVYVEQGTV